VAARDQRVMWIGLLWYFNFVSTPTTVEDSRRSASRARQVYHPGRLVRFRWSAMSTMGFGIVSQYEWIFRAGHTLDLVDPAGAFSDPRNLLIGIGMWLGNIIGSTSGRDLAQTSRKP